MAAFAIPGAYTLFALLNLQKPYDHYLNSRASNFQTISIGSEAIAYSVACVSCMLLALPPEVLMLVCIMLGRHETVYAPTVLILLELARPDVQPALTYIYPYRLAILQWRDCIITQRGDEGAAEAEERDLMQHFLELDYQYGRCRSVYY